MGSARDDHPDDTVQGLREAPVAFHGATAVVALDDHRRNVEPIVPTPDRSVFVKPCRVLVVAPDEDVFASIQDLLARAGTEVYRAEWAGSAEAGLRRLTASHFDVALVDEHLPDHDGLDFVRAAQRRGFRTPIVLLSDDLDPVDPGAAIDLGIGELLEKEELDLGRLARCLRFAIARRARTDRLDRLAQYDDLTGLANRVLLNDRLERALAAARRRRTSVAVMVLDLNGFKAVNDSLGHAGGDRLLQTVAERLRARVRETDTVARLGGDEFALVIENLARPEHATFVARKLLDAIEPPVRLDLREVQVTASLGVALYPQDGEDPAQLLCVADAAMYAAKGQGGNLCRFSDDKLDQRMRRGSILESDLRRALERHEFVLQFQPQVTLCGGSVGLASILLWQHPELGLIETERFRAVAEECGLVEQLTDWLLEGVVAQLRAWRESGITSVFVSMPVLSRRQLAWNPLAERVVARAQEAGLPRSAVELEIEERLVLEEIQAGGEGFQRLIDLGLRLALDRFGAGTTSLRPLRDAPLHTLKIARETLSGVPQDGHRTLFVRGLVRLGKQLGLRVVVEGVETQAQLKILRDEGCDAVQAVTSCPPLPADACTGWLREALGRPGSQEP